MYKNKTFVVEAKLFINRNIPQFITYIKLGIFIEKSYC